MVEQDQGTAHKKIMRWATPDVSDLRALQIMEWLAGKPAPT